MPVQVPPRDFTKEKSEEFFLRKIQKKNNISKKNLTNNTINKTFPNWLQDIMIVTSFSAASIKISTML